MNCLKTIRTKLNEKEYPEFKKEVEKTNLTEYGFLKVVIRHAKEVRQFLEENKMATFCTIYWGIWLYSLAVGRIMLL